MIITTFIPTINDWIVSETLYLYFFVYADLACKLGIKIKLTFLRICLVKHYFIYSKSTFFLHIFIFWSNKSIVKVDCNEL